MIVFSKKLYLATVPLTSTLTEFNSKFFCIIRTHCLCVALLRSTCNLNFVNGTES